MSLVDKFLFTNISFLSFYVLHFRDEVIKSSLLVFEYSLRSEVEIKLMKKIITAAHLVTKKAFMILFCPNSVRSSRVTGWPRSLRNYTPGYFRNKGKK